MKSKVLLLITLIGLLQFNLDAQTNVGGTLSINTTWTVDGSPYNLTSTVGVPSGIILTIEPGVQITGNYDLLIKGNLISSGNAGSLIEIQDTRVIFKSTNLSNSTISYISFDNGGVQLADESEFNQDNPKNTGTLTLNNCEFNNNAYARTKGYETNAFLVISNSKFDNSIIKGYYPRSETIELNTCEIHNSTVHSDSYNKGIFINNSSVENSDFRMGCCSANLNFTNSEVINSNVSQGDGSPVNGDFKIINSKFINCPINLPSAKFTIQNSLILDLTNPTTIKMGNGIIENSSFYGSTTSSSLDITGYSGYNIGGNTTISNTIFCNSLNAITINNTYALNIGNCNYYNINNYNVRNNSSKTITANYNWWGTSNTATISEKIYDMYDDINSGEIDFSNYLPQPDTDAPISAPVNIYKSSSENGTILSWDSNPESDVAGYKIYYNPINEFSYANSIDVGNVNSYTINGVNLSETFVITAYDSDADGTEDLFEGHESWFSQTAQQYFTSELQSGDSYCQGEEIEYQINTIANFEADNNFIIQLSSPSGSFDTPTNLATVNTSTSGLVSTTFPDTLTIGNYYKIRVKSTNPEAVSNIGNVIFHQIPTAEFSLDKDKLCDSDEVIISYNGTGTINANYNWSFNGGNIISGTDQGDYKINWTTPGVKTITLTVRENGCTSAESSKQLNVYQPKSSFSLDNVVCENQNSDITFTGAASASAIYNWDFNGANIVSGDGAGPYVVSWDDLGNKNVSLTINDNGCISAQTTNSISHNTIPTSTFTAPENVCFNGTASIDFIGTAANSANYQWNFNNGSVISGTDAGPFEIMWDTPGQKTILLTVTENGCSSDASANLIVNDQTAPISICMVGVDETNHNMIVWEQDIENSYDSIFIYRQTSQSDVYEKIGSQSASNTSIFIDEDSNPDQNSERYKISVLDTCGYETSMSEYHKTIHLTINTGINGAWNLIWNEYEGFSYSTYNIYRGTDDGNLQKIAEQAGNTTSYTDLTPPAGTTYYQIEVIKPNPCNIGNLKSSDDYSSIKSNIVNSDQATSINELQFEDINIYPNPADDKLYIRLPKENFNFLIEILSLNGKNLIQKDIHSIDSEIDISDLKAGVYLIRLTNDKKSVNMKLIKR